MTEKQLDDRVRGAVGTNVPGVAVVVVGAEGVRARSTVGIADLISGQPMATDIAFPWFSMTKIATATTAIRLAERGVLELDVPVSSLVPAMRLLRPTPWAARITVRHLLQHAAGLANPIPIRWIHAADQPGPDPDAFLERLVAKHPRLRFQPGARSSYSNLGTLALGSAITQATGASFQSVVHDEVLEPLGMSSTAFTFPPENKAATGYHPRHSPMRLLLPRWVTGESSGRWMSFRHFLVDGAPYGGLVGTAEDAARFLRMHLRDGELDGIRTISPDAATQMRSINASGKRYDLGLGWFVPNNQRKADPAFVEHLGGGAGFFNLMRIYPSRGVGVVVMGNATKYDLNAVASLALKYHSSGTPLPATIRRPAATSLRAGQDDEQPSDLTGGPLLQ
jgi:CubicO group peptidase (beta-lactamase class C family)